MSFEILKKTGQMTLIIITTGQMTLIINITIFFSQHDLLVTCVILKGLNYAALKFQSKET